MYVDSKRQTRLFEDVPNERRKHKHLLAEDFTGKFINHNTTDECYIIWKLSPRERAINANTGRDYIGRDCQVAIASYAVTERPD